MNDLAIQFYQDVFAHPWTTISGFRALPLQLHRISLYPRLGSSTSCHDLSYDDGSDAKFARLLSITITWLWLASAEGIDTYVIGLQYNTPLSIWRLSLNGGWRR
jgi:hypothetical protein